ncbi:hypothetical protein GCM10028778_19940 [Barrientosiimonas marina]
MNGQMKKVRWLSYSALVLSILPIPLYMAVLYSVFNWDIDAALFFIVTLMILAFLLALIGLFKKTENKLIAALALVMTLSDGFFIGLILIVSDMVQP